ncbi:MAG: T9SS type A sorting domain-containing protein [Chlorobi bacterium]|nr:T9SS type A sorting domain-containing protein [Chlorobiota bacterium]
MKTYFFSPSQKSFHNSARINFTMLLIFLFGTHVIAQQGNIFTEITADSVTIWHTETERNCFSVFDMQMALDGNHITLMETDTTGIAFCMCIFDLSVGIGNLEAGDYSVDIYSLEPAYPDTVYWGNTTFTITEGGQGVPQLNTAYQSDCYTLCPPPENLQLEVECNEFSITNSGENVSTILGYNLYINGTLVVFIEDFTYYLGSLGNGVNQICITTVCDDGESEAVCWDVEIPYGDPVTGFEIGLSGNDALLTWNAPDGITKSLAGYHVFRDFELLEPNVVTDTFYLDESLSVNTLYQYYITAVYDNCESLPTDTLEFILTGIDIPKQSYLLVFPNPATTTLNIHSGFPVLGFRVFDLIGEKYHYEREMGKDFQVDISEFPGGIYFFQIETSEGIQTKRIVVR